MREQNHSVWDEHGLHAEPCRKVQGGVLGDPIAFVLGGTSRVVLGKCRHQRVMHVVAP